MIALLATVLLATSSANPAASSDPEAAQKQAALRLGVIMEETFAEIGRHVKDGVPFSEGDARAFAQRACLRDGLIADEAPLVAVGPHSADPAWDGSGDAPIHRGDFLLLELAAKENSPGAIYADITWVAFAGHAREIPPRIAKVWGIVREARDRALAEIKARAKDSPSGEQIDWYARGVVEKSKHGPFFPHATGHSLGTKDLGEGPNLKQEDKRPLRAGQCFTIEPGIYYPAEFGVRSGVDVCLGPGGAEVTSGVAQREIRALLE